MIEAHGLVKRYGSTMAVNDLSFSIRPGLVTGFLGPNGAGKTTTMRMILGLDAPTQGSVTVGGRSYRDLPAPMREVGALLDAKALLGGRRARDHLSSTGSGPDVIEITGMDSAEVGRLAAAHGIALSELIPVRASLEEAHGTDPGERGVPGGRGDPMTDAVITLTGPDHRAAFRAATFGDVLRSEWTKLRSVRSTFWALTVTVVLGVGLGAVISAVTAHAYPGSPRRCRTRGGTRSPSSGRPRPGASSPASTIPPTPPSPGPASA